MSTSTVRISEATHQLLQDLAKYSGQTMRDIIDQALVSYSRRVFFEKMNSGYAKLREKPADWAEIEEERKILEGTLMDGLDREESWSEDGRKPKPRKKTT